jgi:hypothetical protein
LREGYFPEDIFILNTTLKGPPLRDNKLSWNNTPAQCLVHELLQLKFEGKPVKVYIPDYDNESSSNLEELSENKIVFSTYNRSKGLERKIVFVMGVDSSYNAYYNKYGDPEICSNTMYVALTRSLHHLIILHHHKKAAIEFLDKSVLAQYSNLIIHELSPKSIPKSRKYTQYIFPSEVTQHLRQSYIWEAMRMINTRMMLDKKNPIILKSKQKDDDNCETISEITSFFVETLHALLVYNANTSSYTEHINDIIACLAANTQKKLPELEYTLNHFGKPLISFVPQDRMNPDCIFYNKKFISYMLEVSTLVSGMNKGFMHKFMQIKNFNWLTGQNTSDLLSKLFTELSDQCEYEKEVILQCDCTNENRDPDCRFCTWLLKDPKYPTIDDRKFLYSGRIDIIDHKKRHVWEIKCVSELREEHFLQLALYKYICQMNNKYTDYRYLLFNIRTREIHKIETSGQELVDLGKYLIDKKYSPDCTDEDDKFISCHAFQ